jgi:signal transduction histidine kinase
MPSGAALAGARSSGPNWNRRWTAGMVASVTIIAVIDGLLPAGVVVGFLLVVPIVLTARSDDPRDVHLVFALSLLGFLLAAQFGSPPLSPRRVWIPNWIFAGCAIGAAGYVALSLQRLRLEVMQQRTRAAESSRLNRLLVSLVAHDLRAPLALASQTLTYAASTLRRHEPVDTGLLGEVQQRLDRSLGDSERLVELAGLDLEPGDDGLPVRRAVRLRAELERILQPFAAEASAAGKRLAVQLDLPDRDFDVDLVVLSHLLGVLIDNAITYARPGTIIVAVRLVEDCIECTVSDPGPADQPSSRLSVTGLGRGRRLADLVSQHYGGRIEDRRVPEGSCVALIVPAVPA